MASKNLSIPPLNKPVSFPREFLTWDPEFMMDISCAFFLCACRGFKNARRLAAARAMCPFKMLVLCYTLKIIDICRQQYSEELFRHASGIPQSLSYCIFTLASRACFSVSWPLLLRSISITFFNMVTSGGGETAQAVSLHSSPLSVFTQTHPASDISFPTLSLQVPFYVILNMLLGLFVIYTSGPFSL